MTKWCALTQGAAYAERQEGQKGSADSGQARGLGDSFGRHLAVVPDRLPVTVSVWTVVNGEVVYEVKDQTPSLNP